MASYRLHRGEPVAAALRRCAHDQVDEALADAQRDDRHEAVHEVRKRCKKVRAALRLVRLANEDLYERENAAFRDAARRISDLRDAHAHLETVDLLADADPEGAAADRYAPVRDGLRERRDELADGRIDDALAAVVRDLEAARDRIDGWDLDADGFAAIAGGLAKTYGRAVDRMADAYDDRTTEAFHEWRKRTKYHRYHVRLLQDLWTPVMRTRRRALHDLTDLQGDDHDLAELRETLRAEPDRYGGEELVAACVGLGDRKRAQLQHAARDLGARCFVEDADAFTARIGGYWEAWERPEGRSSMLADPVVPAGR